MFVKAMKINYAIIWRVTTFKSVLNSDSGKGWHKYLVFNDSGQFGLIDSAWIAEAHSTALQSIQGFWLCRPKDRESRP